MPGDKRDAEILALRHQVLVLQRQIDRPRFTPTDPTILAVLSRPFDRRHLGQMMLIVKPATGAEAIQTPPGAPRANAFAERWVRTVHHELVDRTIIWNEHHLERLLDGYVNHYNAHRPHQSLDQRPPTPTHDPPEAEPTNIAVLRTGRCDGLINEYQNTA